MANEALWLRFLCVNTLILFVNNLKIGVKNLSDGS